ncbi:MAG: IscS subfamily cysteine desulfurase [Phycisphaerae bacterium]|nr:IscS subfamily cysteine desulfurase [Phycisphaerae bacterium]
MKLPVYMDYSATTPVDPAVLEEMLPYFSDQFGNAASIHHKFGTEAGMAVSKARQQVANLIGAEAKEIIFTSGATESNNIAIKGVAERYGDKGKHIITCVTEHKAILDTCKYLEQKGYEVTYLGVDTNGMLDLQELKDAIRSDTILISLMAANNEVGVLHPVKEIGEIAREKGVFFHCDATQAVGKIPIDVNEMKIDLLSLSAHKIYGPKGVGALYARDKNPRVRPTAVLHGGGHEKGMRSGTLNSPGIVGLGKACEICQEVMAEESARLKKLSDKLIDEILGTIEFAKLNGDRQHRLPNVVNLGFAYVEGETLMMFMPELAVSSGSACTSATLGASYVLQAMGVKDDEIHGSLRFSIGRFTTEEEIDFAVECIEKSVHKARALSPLYDDAIQGKCCKYGKCCDHGHGCVDDE